MFPLAPGHHSEYAQKHISMLARAFLKADGTQVTVADIGCYKRPIHDWVHKVAEVEEFVGVDPDQDAIRELAERGITCITPEAYEKRSPFDYSFLLEVVEHIPPADYPGFLANVRDRTSKAVFFTTPNFEGWDADAGSNRLRKRNSLADLRYEPDHLKIFKPDSTNPHDHKQMMTAEILHASFKEVFDVAEWDWIIYKAWPWTLKDCATGAEFRHHFKLHGAIWRRVHVQPRLRAIA